MKRGMMIIRKADSTMVNVLSAKTVLPPSDTGIFFSDT